MPEINSKSVANFLGERLTAASNGESFEGELRSSIQAYVIQPGDNNNLEQSRKDFDRHGTNNLEINNKAVPLNKQGNGGADLEYIKDIFNKLEIKEEFRDAIILNFNQGGSTYTPLAFVSCFLGKRFHEFYTKTNKLIHIVDERTLFGFDKVDDNKVKFKSEFIIKFQDKKEDEKEGEKEGEKESELKCSAEFDFVWNENEEKLSIDNIKLKFTPMGEFKSFLIEKERNNDIKKANAAILISSVLTAVGVVSSVLFTLDIYKKLNIDIPDKIKISLFFSAIVLIHISVSVLFASSICRFNQSNHEKTVDSVKVDDVTNNDEKIVNSVGVDDVANNDEKTVDSVGVDDVTNNDEKIVNSDKYYENIVDSMGVDDIMRGLDSYIEKKIFGPDASNTKNDKPSSKLKSTKTPEAVGLCDHRESIGESSSR